MEYCRYVNNKIMSSVSSVSATNVLQKKLFKNIIKVCDLAWQDFNPHMWVSRGLYDKGLAFCVISKNSYKEKNSTVTSPVSKLI